MREPLYPLVESEFQIGDVVRLKSGGPEMTVTYSFQSSFPPKAGEIIVMVNFIEEEVRRERGADYQFTATGFSPEMLTLARR